MAQAIFQRAKAESARFTGADLTYVDFTHADLSAGDFSHATLFRTRLHGAVTLGAAFGPGRALALGDDPEQAEAETWVRRPR
jgi:uncharacterized protein YjbI with pentapeptide repeats